MKRGSKKAPKRKTRSGMAGLAERLGLSQAAVSMALRGKPGVSEATRARVKEAAAAAGYQLDVAVSALAERRWRQAGRRRTLNLAVLAVAASDAGVMRMCEWAWLERQAIERGYGLTAIAWNAACTGPVLARILRSRNVVGVCLLAIEDESQLKGLDLAGIPWGICSWVAVNENRFLPPVHTVRFHASDNMLRALKGMAGAGFRRIAVVREPNELSRLNFEHHMGVLQFRALHPEVEVSDFAFAYETAKVEAMLREAKPEAILWGYPELRRRFKGAVIRLPWASLGLLHEVAEGVAEWVAGVPLDGLGMLAHSLDLLDLQYRRGERGLPKRHMVVMLEGEWRSGPTLER